MLQGRNLGFINYNRVYSNDALIAMCKGGELVKISGWGMTETNERLYEEDARVRAKLKVGIVRFIADRSGPAGPNGQPIPDYYSERFLLSDDSTGQWLCNGDSGGNI